MMLRSSSLLLLFVFTFRLSAQDTLAADEKAASYRIGTPDEKSIKVPADLQQSVFNDSASNLGRLVTYLTSDTSDEFLKAKRIHDWITDNIAYDSDLLLGLSDEGSRKVNDLIKLKRTTCGGYAATFLAMAKVAGLEAQQVTGHSKTCWIKKSNRDCHHVWNAIRISGKWYIIDSTADGRMSYKFGAFSAKKRYSDRNLFLKPSSKLLVNFPMDEKQQFVSSAVTQSEFESTPRVSLSYDKYNLRYDSASAARFKTARRDFDGGNLEKLYDEAISDSPIFEVRLDTPEDLLLFPQLVQSAEESFDDAADSASSQKADSEDKDPVADMTAYVFCRKEKQVICQFSPPTPGVYKAYIHARRPDETSPYELVHAFTLKTKQPGKILPETAGVIYPNAMFRRMNATIAAREVQSRNGFLSIEASRPADLFLSSIVTDISGKSVQAAVEATFPTQEARRFYYRFPAPGTYFIRLFTCIPNKEGAPRQNIALTRVEVPAASPQSFPPEGELIFSKYFLDAKASVVSSQISGPAAATIRVKSETPIYCTVTDLKTNKQVEFGCIMNQKLNDYEFVFRAPENGNYTAAITELGTREGEKQRRVLMRFRMEKSMGQPLPIIGKLWQHSQMKGAGISVVSENVATANDEVIIAMRVPENISLDGRLFDSEGKAVAKAVKIEKSGTDTVMRFKIPGPGSYAGKCLIKDGNNPKLIAVFRIQK